MSDKEPGITKPPYSTGMTWTVKETSSHRDARMAKGFLHTWLGATAASFIWGAAALYNQGNALTAIVVGAGGGVFLTIAAFAILLLKEP